MLLRLSINKKVIQVIQNKEALLRLSLNSNKHKNISNKASQNDSFTGGVRI